MVPLQGKQARCAVEALQSKAPEISETCISFWAAPKTSGTRRRLKVGVVGCGYWGSKHIRILNSLSDVDGVAAIDSDARVREKMASAFPASRIYKDLEAALPDIDALIIATPPRTHFDVALKCLHHGKHVLLEKPMARSLTEACALIEEAHSSNTILMVGHTFEFNPAVRELKRRMNLGEFGRINYLHSARLNLGIYRPDVNVIWDLAPHDISIMNYLLGSVPTAVAAWGSTCAGMGTEDIAYIRMEYREVGVTAYARLSWLDPNKVREVIVVGSKKMAIYNDLIEERLRIFDRGIDLCEQSTASFERPLTYRYGDIVSPHITFQEPLSLELKHFIDCVRDGAPPETDGYNGLAVIAVLEAIDEAVATGATVKVRYPSALDPIKINGRATISA
jgi:predicted dehydrogenase